MCALGPRTAASRTAAPPALAQIVALEGSIRALKEAARITSLNLTEQDTTETAQWRDAARGAAEQLWALGGSERPPDDPFQKPSDARSHAFNADTALAGADAPTDGDGDAFVNTAVPTPPWTLGTMLAATGVNPDVLGWDTDAGEFRA